MTGSRMTLLATAAALAFSAPAHAQSDPPPGLFQPASAEDAGTVTPTDTGRSTVLLGLALVSVGGAGLLAGLATPAPRRRATREQALSEAPATTVDAPAAAPARAAAAAPAAAAPAPTTEVPAPAAAFS